MDKTVAGLTLLVGSCTFVGLTHAGGFDLALSNETANIALQLNPRPFIDGRYDDGYGNGAELSIGGFISEVDDRLAHLTLMAYGPRPTADSIYNFALGVKAIGGDVVIEADRRREEDNGDAESVGALALGIQAGMLLNRSARNPIELGVAAFVAPSITSFADADRFAEYSARLQMDVIPQASAYLGYRRMRWDTNDYSSIRTEQGLHLGIKLSWPVQPY